MTFRNVRIFVYLSFSLLLLLTGGNLVREEIISRNQPIYSPIPDVSPAPPKSGFGELLKEKSPSPPGAGHGFAELLKPPPLTLTPTPVPPSPTPAKNSFTVALFGDSMIDTMGENLEYLQKSLKQKYPNIKFVLYNYGIGSQNAEAGLERFSSFFSYKTRDYPPISLLPADIFVLGSFAYNPFSPHSRDRHWLALAQLIQKARSKGAMVYLLAEIAPLEKGFGKGPGGVNWPEELAHKHSLHIIEQLDNTIGLAQILNVPLINVYEKSKINGSKFGNPKYVNPSDGIHPSVAGHIFTANLIASALKLR